MNWNLLCAPKRFFFFWFNTIIIKLGEKEQLFHMYLCQMTTELYSIVYHRILCGKMGKHLIWSNTERLSKHKEMVFFSSTITTTIIIIARYTHIKNSSKNNIAHASTMALSLCWSMFTIRVFRSYMFNKWNLWHQIPLWLTCCTFQFTTQQFTNLPINRSYKLEIILFYSIFDFFSPVFGVFFPAGVNAVKHNWNEWKKNRTTI